VSWLAKRRTSESRLDNGLGDAQHQSVPHENSRTAAVRDEIGLQYLPNDLTRMIYLASLRDCNSGVYLHPELSQRLGIRHASTLLHNLHQTVFDRLLETRVPEYVPQLVGYIRYSKTDTRTMLHNWNFLQAYRATIPLHTKRLWAEVYFMNIETAIVILQRDALLSARLNDYQQARRESRH
jgi:hypothetical protein